MEEIREEGEVREEATVKGEEGEANPGVDEGSPFSEAPEVDRLEADELDGVRELILKAYPDVVVELVAGDSVDALLASVPAAREAYAQVAATVQAQTPAAIPTGSGRRPAIDPERLSPEAKIQAGLRRLSL